MGSQFIEVTDSASAHGDNRDRSSEGTEEKARQHATHRELACTKALRQKGAGPVEGIGEWPHDWGRAEKMANMWEAEDMEVMGRGVRGRQKGYLEGKKEGSAEGGRR